MGRLIDADALCRHLSDWQFGSMTDGKHDAEYEVINKVIDGIEQEPTVDAVERKRGKWVRKDLGGWHCSECDNQAPFPCMASCQYLTNYCPNCGADMRKGEEE